MSANALYVYLIIPSYVPALSLKSPGTCIFALTIWVIHFVNSQNIWFTCAESASIIKSRYVGIQKYSYPSGCSWQGSNCEVWTIKEIDVFDHPAKYV